VPDKVLDSILSEAPRAPIDISSFRYVYAPIFDRASLHFQLLLIDVGKHNCYFIDPNPPEMKSKHFKHIKVSNSI